MSHLPLVGRAAVVTRGAAVLAVAVVALSACSALAPTRASSPQTLQPSATPSPTPSPSKSQPAAVGVDLPLEWITPALRRTGTGFAMTLTTTSHTDVYDGRYFQRAVDGAISNQVPVTIKVTSRTTVDVTFPDASPEPGLLSLAEDGSKRTTLDLGPACVSALPGGANASDCVLVARNGVALGTASPSASASTPAPDSTASVDQAMSYLCSVDVVDLPKLTKGNSDSYATSVAQIALTQIGYDPGNVDGVYGPATKAAVRDYQTAAGLTVDGLVGPQTWTSLQADACRVASDPAQ